MTRLGLRGRLALAFSVGALALASLLSVGAWTVTSQIMFDQRMQLAQQQGQVMSFRIPDDLAQADTAFDFQEPLGTDWWVKTNQHTWSSSTTDFREPPQPSVREQQSQWTSVGGERAAAVWTPADEPGVWLLEVTVTRELNTTLETLRKVLIGCAVLVTAVGGLYGHVSARRVLRPLEQIGATATAIATGRQHEPLSNNDPELAEIIGAFNDMVASLQRRIERDGRFAADAAHELKSPLTTLVGCTELLVRRRDQFDARTAVTVDLLQQELVRFRAVLEDLLELGRYESEDSTTLECVRLAPLVAAHLAGRDVRVEIPADLEVLGNPRLLSRAISNLIKNADLHGRGLVGISARHSGGHVALNVDDAGPGVPLAERELVFERFRRGGARGNLPGSGLGLSLVAQAAASSGGSVRCTSSPQGGARFVMTLPAPPASESPN